MPFSGYSENIDCTGNSLLFMNSNCLCARGDILGLKTISTHTEKLYTISNYGKVQGTPVYIFTLVCVKHSWKLIQIQIGWFGKLEQRKEEKDSLENGKRVTIQLSTWNIIKKRIRKYKY